jgi:hypothetical protein
MEMTLSDDNLDQMRAMTIGELIDLLDLFEPVTDPDRARKIAKVLGLILAHAAYGYFDNEDDHVARFALAIADNAVDPEEYDETTAENIVGNMESLAWIMAHSEEAANWKPELLSRLHRIQDPAFEEPTGHDGDSHVQHGQHEQV